MNFYYDTAPVYPYICLSEINSSEIEEIIDFLRLRNIIVNKFYEKPKYPASDGKIYDYLFRINFSNPQNRIKPDKKTIENNLQEYLSIKNINNRPKENNSDFINEQKYISQIRAFIDSERKIIDIDKSFLKEQLQLINSLSQNLSTENKRLAKIIDSYNKNFDTEIKSIKEKTKSNNEEIVNLEKALKEKEILLLEKENDLNNQLSKVEKARLYLIEYKHKLDKERQDFVQDIRNIQLGITEPEEDNYQDLKILVFGDSKLNENEIYEIFNFAFHSKFGEELKLKSVETQFLRYKDVKNSNIIKKIESDKFDYLIVGPHDHSVKGKNIKTSFKNYCEDRNLKCFVYESTSQSLNKDNLEQTAIYLMQDWEKISSK